MILSIFLHLFVDDIEHQQELLPPHDDALCLLPHAKYKFQYLDGVKLKSKKYIEDILQVTTFKNKYALPYGINSRVVHVT
jgi:hypothetical protein